MANETVEGILEEIRNLRIDFNQMQKTIEKTQDTISKMQDTISKMQDTISGMQNTISGMQDTISKMQDTLVLHTKSLMELTRTVGELRAQVGSFTRRMGMALQSTVLRLYEDALKLRGLDIDRILRMSYKDERGALVYPGGEVEVDIYMHDRDRVAVEVKNFVEDEDVAWFHNKLRFLKAEHRIEAKPLIVAVTITDTALEVAKKFNIDVVYGAVIPSKL